MKLKSMLTFSLVTLTCSYMSAVTQEVMHLQVKSTRWQCTSWTFSCICFEGATERSSIHLFRDILHEEISQAVSCNERNNRSSWWEDLHLCTLMRHNEIHFLNVIDNGNNYLYIKCLHTHPFTLHAQHRFPHWVPFLSDFRNSCP